jgi:MFS family permease
MPSPALSSPTIPSTPSASPSPAIATPTFRRWTIAVTVYVAAVFNRTSLGVAGLEAASRFRITPGQLSVFVLAQLGVYAAMQVPTGLLVDRYGPRRLLITAACTMAVAQLAFAFVQSYPGALLARAILGCGDAMTFVSVVRFAAQDFAPRRFPLAVSVTSMLGMVGNLAATIPLTLLLHAAGWTPSFAGTGLVSLATGVAVWALLPAEPPGAGARPARGWSRWTGPMRSRVAGKRAAGSGAVGSGATGRGAARARRAHALLPAARRVSSRVHAAWRTPGTRLGFWVHFSCMSLTTTFSVLWGVPYLVAQGFSPAAAGGVLLVCVLAAIAVSPAVGMVFGRFPAARVPFAVGVCLVTVAGWVTLLACFGGRPPHPLIIAVAALMAAGGPASTIGFSLARDYNGRTVVGTATGVVNVGGFSAAILTSLLVGGILDLAGRSDVPAYRLAFGCAVAVQLLGTVMAVWWWLRVRGLLLGAQSRGEPVPVRVVERPFDRAAGHHRVRVSSREARGTVSAARRRDRSPAPGRSGSGRRNRPWARRGHDEYAGRPTRSLK